VERGLTLVPGGGSARVEDGAPAQAGAQGLVANSASHGADPLPAHAPTLSELFAASPRDAGWAGFLLSQLEPGKPLLWVQERMAILEGGRVHPAGLGPHGPELIHVEARDARAVLWAMEEGLRCPALSAVIGELWGDPAALDFTATRRLAVAAERHGVAAMLVRLGGRADLSGARRRWRIASAPSAAHPFDPRAPGAPQWDAELFRARGAAPGRWLVTHDGTAHLLPVATPAGDRALGEAPRRRA
jgi:protein ImuA